MLYDMACPALMIDQQQRAVVRRQQRRETGVALRNSLMVAPVARIGRFRAGAPEGFRACAGGRIVFTL
jgi:hypothetical protein